MDDIMAEGQSAAPREALTPLLNLPSRQDNRLHRPRAFEMLSILNNQARNNSSFHITLVMTDLKETLINSIVHQCKSSLKFTQPHFRIYFATLTFSCLFY